MMKHEKGGYVFEAAIRAGGPNELLALAGGLYKHPIDLIGHLWAGNRMADLTRRLVHCHRAESVPLNLRQAEPCVSALRAGA